MSLRASYSNKLQSGKIGEGEADATFMSQTSQLLKYFCMFIETGNSYVKGKPHTFITTFLFAHDISAHSHPAPPWRKIIIDITFDSLNNYQCCCWFLY